MLIEKFFEDKEILITGGSGFIGKALIEKLLRSCPNVGKIYVILRSKRGKNAQERLHDILQTPLFNRLREEQPQTFQKVHAIEGDCMELKLGICAADLEKLQNINIIYHSAASVRFDDPLRDAILMNTRGTHELVKIALTLKNLVVFMHVSTTYCYPNRQELEEKIYPPYADWRTTIKLAETYNAETLNVFNLKYSDFQPNTYTFTKCLAEHIIYDYKDKLPFILFRPSIVISSLDEPVPGWVDNFNGPIGMLVASGIGILRTNYAEPNTVSDFVPVDIAVRAMLIATCKRATRGNDEVTELDIINCSTSTICPISTGEIVELGKRIIKENPFEKTLWVPGGSITRCRVWNFLRFVTLHIFMAILVDAILRFTGKKPFLLRLQRRIYAANLALHFFVTTQWVFKNDNFSALHDFVDESEFNKFCFLQYSNIDTEDFIRQGIRGARVYLLNEPPVCTQAAHRRFKIYQVLHFLIKLGCWLLIGCFIWRYVTEKLF